MNTMEGKLYREIAPRPLLKETDLRTLTIVTTPKEGWKQAGQELAQLILEKWNVKVVVECSEDVRIKNNWSGNYLLIGNLANNPYIAGLYSLYMVYTDAVHPGNGGYQLQTIVDPFGKGGNTILFGVSDTTGLLKGMQRLTQIINELTDPLLPWCSESKLPDDVVSALPYGKSPTQSQIQDMLKSIDVSLQQLDCNSTKELPSKKLHSLLSNVMQYGRLYQLTNDEGYGQAYRHGWISYANFVNRYPETALSQLSSRNMWTFGYPLMASYNVMEASPLFIEEDREQIGSAIYLTYEANSHDGYLKRAPATGARFNHDIFPALSIIFGSTYFLKYYNLPETKQWYELGDRMFKGNTSNINLDEGSDYLMHVPAITLEYAFITGDNRFLSKGLKPSADLFAMMIDNLGTMSGGGDVYPFGYSSAYSWNHSQVMNAATWFFGEPLYKFLLERTKEGPFSGQGMKDLDFPFHRYVHDTAVTPRLEGKYPMVQAYPVERGVYDDLQKDQPDQPLDIGIEDTFHKLAFREGYHQDDAYLMLDGFSAGRHGHMDGNTIIKYSAKGRIFIDDRDYIEKAPKNHTGMLVIKDGVQQAKPPLAGVEWAADAGGVGLSRTIVPNYNGVDWIRTIVTMGGRFFLIYDDMKVNEDGKYIFENTWQTLGDIRLIGDRFDVMQEGVMMNLQSLDDSSMRSYERYGHFVKYWKLEYPYPYADQEHVLRQVKEEKEYNKGDRIQFINVLSSSAFEEPSVHAKSLNDQTVCIDENDNKIYACYHAISTSRFESDGKFHMVYDHEILAADVRNVRIGTLTLFFNKPAMFKLNCEAGHWTAYRIDKALARYDDVGNPIKDGTIEEGTCEVEKELVEELKKSLSKPTYSNLLTKPAVTKKNTDDRWVLHFCFSEQVTASCAGDINHDGESELIVGGIKGKVQAICSTGQVLWTFQGKGRINEVTVQYINKEAVIFIATEDWYVHVLDCTGKEKWSILIPNEPVRRERKGNLLGVTNIRLAYVNGKDKEPWVMVGTQFRYLYGVDLQGNLLYEDIAYFYGIEDMTFLDLDGDGKDEGILALEYYNLCIWKDRDFKHYGGAKVSGPGFKVVKGLDQKDGVIPAAAVYGTKQNYVHMIRNNEDLEHLWNVNVGGEVNDLIVGDFDQDGFIEILVASDGFMLYCINLDGSVRWKTTLSDRVMKVTAINTEEGVVYLASIDNGGLFTLDSKGNVMATHSFSGLIQNVHVGASSKAWVVLQDGSIYNKLNNETTKLHVN